MRAGGPDLGIFKIEFSIVHDREEPQLPDTFLPDQKILILAKVIAFSNLGFTGNYTTRNLATEKLTPPSFFEIIA